MQHDSPKNFNLAARILSKNVDAEESAPTEFAGSPEFDALLSVWQLTGWVKAPEPPNDLWQRLNRSIRQEEDAANGDLKIHRFRSARTPKGARYFARLAAGLLLAAFSYWVLQNMFFQTITVATQNAERKTVTLPDGSIADLNAASRLTYSKDGRSIELEGEAFFQVSASDKQFVVRAENTKVTVLGTAFNVRVRQKTVSVVVERGEVAFEDVAGNRVNLHSGEMSHLRARRMPTTPVKVEIDKYLAWREGRIEFERTSLSDVLAELERQFDVDIDCGVPDSERLSLTASFSLNQKIEEVLSAICLTFGWIYRQADGSFIIETSRQQP